jgi:hypothetical protein
MRSGLLAFIALALLIAGLAIGWALWDGGSSAGTDGPGSRPGVSNTDPGNGTAPQTRIQVVDGAPRPL